MGAAPRPAPQRPGSEIPRGLILTVADVAESREFYEKVLRLAVTRETRYAVVFAGWLALEQSDDAAKPPHINDGNSTIVLYTDPHGAEAMTEHLSQMHELFREHASERGSFIELHDPDGNEVHIRWSSTPAFA